MFSKVKSLKDGAYEYSEDDKLGEGSFAKVYKGIITKNKRVVAVRLLPLKLIDQYGQRIKQIITGQVSVLKDLSLSNSNQAIFTTRIYDCFITQNNVIMILQYCPQGNLQDIIKKSGPLNQSSCLQIIYQLAKGLEFIAKQKVVHRDIKPDNIFIKRQGKYMVYKLGDFGFAVKKQLNQEIVGTPIFMSPELFREEQYGSEVDVWAFGLMVHYMLFKEFYFVASSEQQIKKRVLSQRYQLKQHHLSKITKQMSDFLTRCLKRQKQDRMAATQISRHAVFSPIRQKVEQMIKEVIQISNTYQSSLFKGTLKAKISNQIVRYSFLMDLASTFGKINQYNYATLYMYKHALGELVVIRNNMQGKVNFLNHPEWTSFCASQDYEKSGRILKALIQKAESSFEMTFNNVIPSVRNNYGQAVARGIQQNLGKGPFDPINPDIICYQLQTNWFSWLQQNKSPETHLLGLELILALHMYQKKPIDFDFTTYQMQKEGLGVAGRTQVLEKSMKG